MSVLVSDRTESKFEPITYSTELHNMLREFMQRNFGVKDLEHFVQLRYAYGKDDTEDFGKYRSAVTISCTVTRDGYYSGIFPSSTTTSYMRSPKGSCLNCLRMTNSSTGCSLLYLTVSRLTFLICRTRNMRPAWRIRSTSLITGMFQRIC